jgi:serine/threonine protein kinase
MVAGAGWQHESLIRFHGAFYNEGTIAVALEYMTGGSVSDVVKLSGGVPEKMMAYMAEQILQGIAFMHSRKQVHHARRFGGLFKSQFSKICRHFSVKS